MAFGAHKETKEEKQARKERELLARYGLDRMEHMEYTDALRKIAYHLAGSGLMEAGLALSGGRTADRITHSYLRTIMDQNFIMIRQYDRHLPAGEKHLMGQKKGD